MYIDRINLDSVATSVYVQIEDDSNSISNVSQAAVSISWETNSATLTELSVPYGINYSDVISPSVVGYDNYVILMGGISQNSGYGINVSVYFDVSKDEFGILVIFLKKWVNH